MNSYLGLKEHIQGTHQMKMLIRDSLILFNFNYWIIGTKIENNWFKVLHFL